MNATDWVYAYEMDAGPNGIYWEVYGDGMEYILSVDADDFGDWLSHALSKGFDVSVNTFESWLEYESSSV